MNTIKHKYKIKTIVIYLFLSIFSFVMIFPFIWMILTSLKTQTQALRIPPEIIPNPFMWENYYTVLHLFPFGRAFMNSLIIAVFGVSFFIFTSMMSAYAFAKIQFPGRDKIFTFLLISLMIPFQVTMVPVMLIMKNIGLGNSLAACILYAIFANTYGVFMLRQFIKGLPNDMEESAIIDGCNHWTVFIKIIVPLLKAPVAALTIFNFIANWNNFIQPLIFLNSQEKFPIPILLFMFQGRYVSRLELSMAAACLAFLPVFIVYLFLQKNIIEGIAFTGLKA